MYWSPNERGIIMVYNGKSKMVIYEETGGRYHVSRFVTQGNWENICDIWFDTLSELKDWAD